MKRKVFIGMLAIILLVCLMSCASETPWRKAAVETFEILGVGIGAARDTTEALKVSNVISAEQVLKVKAVYNKAVAAYAAAGNALKVAGQAQSVASRDASLEEYGKLLADFKNLSLQLYDLVKNFKKVSLNEVMETVRNGGDLWLQ